MKKTNQVPPTVPFTAFPQTFAVCRLPVSAPIPDWALQGAFLSVTRTEDELSIVCEQARVPSEVRVETDWRCLKVLGPLDFSLTGILASLAVPLAQAQISLFAISTFDTDYILVKAAHFSSAVKTLVDSGHRYIV